MIKIYFFKKNWYKVEVLFPRNNFINKPKIVKKIGPNRREINKLKL